MENLKFEVLRLAVFISLFSGCQTNESFKMKTDTKKELNVITVSTDRVLQECYFLNATDENKWRHQYILNVLNEKREVVPINYPTNQDIDSCKDHAKKVERILKGASTVRICARGALEVMPEGSYVKDPKNDIYDYGTLGKHESPYYFLTFDTICNSKDCVTLSDNWTYTCDKADLMPAK